MVEKKQKFAKIIGKGQIENGRRGLKFLMFGLRDFLKITDFVDF